MNAQSHHAPPVGLQVESRAVPASREKHIHLFDVLAIIAVTGLLLGVTDIFGAGSFSGLCLAIGAICYGLALIVKVIQKAEAAAREMKDNPQKRRTEGGAQNPLT
jgi:hypothetical protein